MSNSQLDNQVKQWEDSAKSGDAKASLLLANYFHDIGDAATAFNWYLHTSKQNDANPLVFFYLGYAYQYGEGTQIDMIEAFSMYKKAAAYDVPQALYSLAYFYQNGIVVPKDEISAVSYMKQATQKMDALYLMQYDSNADRERLRADVCLQKETVTSLLHKNESLVKENGKLSEQISQAKSKIAEKDKSIDELIQKIKFAEQLAQTQKKELSEEYEQKIVELKHQNAEFQNKISVLTVQNGELRNQLQEMSNHETDLWKEIDDRDKKIQEHITKIGEYERSVNECNLQLTKCSNALQTSKAEAEKLSKAVFRMTYWIDTNLNVEFSSQSLSIFSKYPFAIDGVNCISVESFLQSLKFKNLEKQKSICDMPPERARKLGNRKTLWKKTGNLWWKGAKIKRSSSEYQLLLNRVFEELYKNSNFARALKYCGNIEILRTVATINAKNVILSEDEFVSRLISMRSMLQK